MIVGCCAFCRKPIEGSAAHREAIRRGEIAPPCYHPMCRSTHVFDETASWPTANDANIAALAALLRRDHAASEEMSRSWLMSHGVDEPRRLAAYLASCGVLAVESLTDEQIDHLFDVPPSHYQNRRESLARIARGER